MSDDVAVRDAPGLWTAGGAVAPLWVADAMVHRWARQGRVRCARRPGGGQRSGAARIRRLPGSRAQGSGQP